MCYSAEAWEDYRQYACTFGTDIDIHQFVRLYGDRERDAKIKILKGMDVAFADPHTPEERQIKALIDAFNSAEVTKLEQEAFKQKKRLADAERTLKAKATKAATESKRIATDKIEWALGKLADIRRTEPKPRDSRIFPGHYPPVMVSEYGNRVVKPMRYQCRPAGKPAFYDRKYPGTYNARRDNLEGPWNGQFGYSHGIMVVNAFYENVSRHKLEGRELAPGEKEENVVLQFKPTPTQDMLVACLWSHWTGAGESDLLSFTAITDHRRAAGGNRGCGP